MTPITNRNGRLNWREPLTTQRAGFTLAELLVVLGILGLLTLAYFARPRLTICRELSKRLVCGSNLKGIGTSMKIYANENSEAWPAPPFDESLVGVIDYTLPAGGGGGSVRSPDRFQQSVGGPGGARQLTTTRAMWILVRAGDVTVKQFVCPESGELDDPTPNLNLAYDFAGPQHVSYGYQVPYGPYDTRPREGMDNRMILAADKGPYKAADVPVPDRKLPAVITSGSTYGLKLGDWARFNSPNHLDGQNALFADGHVTFHKVPTIGIDGDNIYTVALDNEFEVSRTHGESPWLRSAPPFVAPGAWSSTDSVIFP